MLEKAAQRLLNLISRNTGILFFCRMILVNYNDLLAKSADMSSLMKFIFNLIDVHGAVFILF